MIVKDDISTKGWYCTVYTAFLNSIGNKNTQYEY